MNEIIYSNEKIKIINLDWDTRYFGVKSARVNILGKIYKENLYKILDLCKDFEFITISNGGNSYENNYLIGSCTNAFLTDMNIKFTKRIISKPISMNSITEVHNFYSYNDRIIDIAKNSFIYSRFYNDPLLPPNKVKNIYLCWTEGAFSQHDKFFVTTKINDKFAGYILFSIDYDNKSISIELIAVDKECRRQNVGKSLIFGLELFAYENGIDKIIVGTQADNTTAIRFYNDCRFLYNGCSSIYHLWRTNKYNT